MPSTRQAVLRTLATGAFVMAVVPGLAVWATRTDAPKSVVLKVQMVPVDETVTTLPDVR